LSDRALRVAAAVVALAGLAVAVYLTWAHFADTSVVCVVGGSCDKVQSSEYSEILGVPVALLGAISYVTILGLIAWDIPLAKLGAAMLALIGLLFGAYLLIVQLFVIDAVCAWCVANDVVIAPALAALTGLRLRS
jgi:uncharacterized membrane protein